ncbi:MAG: endonuclease III [Propionicimonas sp.]
MDASRTALVRRARRIFRTLGDTYPDAHCELDYDNAWQLLVATVLSAQSTDRRVNTVTPTLFARFPTPVDLAAADRTEVEELIKSTGFFRAKTDSLLRLSAALLADFGGEVPTTAEQLTTLPGVGRKTANVVLSDAFGKPALTTDTHFIRLSRRFGWTSATDPVKIESEVATLFERGDWNQLNHRLIWHGRRRCHARRPACGACPVAQWCPSFGEGPVDEKVAAKLIREPRR